MLHKKDNILNIFLMHPGKEFHFREIARLSSLSTTATKSKLEELKKKGIVDAEKKGNLIIFSSRNTDEYKEAKKQYTLHIIKESGLLKLIVDEFRHPQVAVLFGSAARGEDTEKSDVDIFIISSIKKDVDFSDFEKKFSKKINAIIMTPKEFDEIKKKTPEFINNIINGVILYGYLEVF